MPDRHFSNYLAGHWPKAEAVTTEPGRYQQSVQPVNRTEYRNNVRKRINDASPRRLHSQLGDRWKKFP